MKKLGIINVLGSKYTVILKNYNEDSLFQNKESPACGHCNFMTKEISICNMLTMPDCSKDSPEVAADYLQVIMRHEIIHAFLYESGLDSSALDTVNGWARNEEMIDWIAIQLPKMIKEMQKVAAL